MKNRSKGLFSSVLLVLLAATSGAAVCGAQAPPQQAEQESEARQRGAAIAAAAGEAAGGATLAKVESVELTFQRRIYGLRGVVEEDIGSFPTSTGRIQVPSAAASGPIETELLAWLVYPGRMRLEETIVQPWVTGGYSPYGGGGGPVTPTQATEKRTFYSAEGYDGDSGWLKTQTGTRDLPFNDYVNVRMDQFGGLGICRQAAAGKLEAEFVGEEQVEGHKALAVKWILPRGTVKLYFDPQTHLLVGTTRQEQGPEGTFDVLQTWGDYRRVSFKSGDKKEEIQFPYASVTYRNGKKYIEEKVKKIKLNTQPNPKIFSRPK